MKNRYNQKAHNAKKALILKSYYRALNKIDKEFNKCCNSLNKNFKSGSKKVFKNNTRKMLLVLGEWNYLLKDLKRASKKFKRL